MPSAATSTTRCWSSSTARAATAKTRYSPANCLGCIPQDVTGDPDPKHVSTSYVERQNLTMRMNMRRFTRLTNAFSKKIENHAHSVALFYMHYNFVRIHQTLRVTPAMEAGIAQHVWSIQEMCVILGVLGELFADGAILCSRPI